MTIRSWRRFAAIAQAALVLGLPFVTVGGESALRFDVPTLRLHVFGATIWIDELFVVLAGSLALVFAFFLVTLVFGRLWCGWACPQTALIDLTGFFERARRKGGWALAGAHGALAAASLVVAANLVWYFVPPAEFLAAVRAFSTHPVTNGAWLVTAVVLYADLALWREQFCATTCPYARFQGALLDRHSMAIAYDARRDDDCIDCKACVRVCPVGIDIRDGLQAACTGCGGCIDACAPIMAKLRRAPKLIGYFFGEPGTRARWIRPGVVALAVLTAGAVGLTAAVAAGRDELEMTITSSGDVVPQRLTSGARFHGVGIALENRGRDPLRVAFTVRAPGADLAATPSEVSLGAGEHRRVVLGITARGVPAGAALDATLTATASGRHPVTLERTLRLAGREERR